MRIRHVIVAAALAGCMDRPIASVYPVQGKVETKDLPANPEKDVDILFLIDNSGSMAAEQASLQANFPKFMQVLETLEGGAPNMHIGVATSDLGEKASDGVGNVAGFGCTGSGEDGVLRSAPAIDGRFIIDEQSGSGRNRNYAGTLGDAFSAIAGVGTAGCGIEQHLAGIERALQNPANAGFVRPEAKLAVIVIADEDDCSLAHHDLFQTGVDGISLNFRCTKSGIACRDNPDLAQPGVRTDCEPQDPSRYLEPVARYADFLKSLKPNWRDDVLVAGIVGDSSPFEIVLDAMQRPVLNQSCRYGNGDGAFPALRTASFLAQFPQTAQNTICGADLSAAMVEIAAKLKRSFGDPCWEGEVADLDPATPGLQPECTVSDVQVLPDGSTKEIAAIPSCSSGRIPCWKLVEDTAQCFYTSTHLELVIDRGGVVPPSDTHVQASCVTADPGGGGFR
jgi:hypothetical protein